MKLKTTLATLILLLGPSIAAAQCAGEYHDPKQTVMSCALGMVIDEETGTCVPVSTS